MKKVFICFLFVFFVASDLWAKGLIRVSSKIDSEGLLLGNLIKYSLIDQGFEVEDKIQLGATSILRTAIKSDQIDIYPEYTGNGPFFFDIKDRTLFNDFKKGYETIKKLDFEKNNLVWLEPAPASNGWAIAGRKDFCKKNNLKTMEDFAEFVRKGNQVKLAASDSFITRFDALPAFEEVYGFKLKNSQLVSLSSTNTSVTLKAAALNTDGVNFSMTYSTDGALSALGLYVLEDTKSVQPIYSPCPVIRKEVLIKHPEIEKILSPVFLSLDLETLQSLNSKIAVMGYPPSQVAKNYLESLKK
ncbi:MAG: ABC transporter substrate-binding protein [Desulforegulaceae bacterium]|nr:ABC transporter substrate-binding protein [Desulforegulaceae bacterium]